METTQTDGVTSTIERIDNFVEKKYGSGQNGDEIHMLACGVPQHFQSWVYDQKTGQISLKYSKNQCIHVQNLTWANGTKIHTWDCSKGSKEEKSWDYDAQTGEIRARYKTTKCLSMKYGDWRDWNAPHIWD